MQKKYNNVENLLNFLTKVANKNIFISALDSILEFLKTDGIDNIIDNIINNFKTTIDFHSYFISAESIEQLKELKSTDSNTYYQIIHLENILLNMLLNLMDMDYTIILNSDNLEESYFLAIKFKK